MIERFKLLVLRDLLPKIVRRLKEKHKECTDKYEVFWDSMEQVFADDFKKDPETTLDRFIKLKDEECAWEKGDFMTRDLLLDNFIGREMARAIRDELERYGYFDEALYYTWTDFEKLPRLIKENRELKAEVKSLREKLGRALMDKKAAEENLKELKDMMGKGTLTVIEEKETEADALRKEADELRERCKNGERMLEAYTMSYRGKKLAGMAQILTAIWELKGVTPCVLEEKTGLKNYKIHEGLTDLIDLGLVKREFRGFYMPAGDTEGDVELVIARRMIARWMS